jgi:hypothetical protein
MIIETLRQKVEATEKIAGEGCKQIKVFHLPEKQSRINQQLLDLDTSFLNILGAHSI